MPSIWNTALNILARREHSREELLRKLFAKFPDQDSDINEVLDRLVAQNLQSDQRFAEIWFRSEISKGRGPVRIRAESRQKGIESELTQLIETSETDWFEMALAVCRKKFQYRMISDNKPKAYRFLSQRGFTSEVIQYAVETHLHESASEI